MITSLTLPNFRDYLWAGLVGAILGAMSLISPLIGFAAVLGFIALVAALTWPILMCYALIPAIIMTSGMPRGMLVPMLIPNEAVLALSMGLAFFVVLIRKRQVGTIPAPVVIALALYVVGTSILPIIGYMARQYPLSMSEIFSLIAPVQYIVLFWLFSNIPESDAERQGLVQWMLVWASVVALVGLMQGFRIGPVTSLLQQWYPSKQLESAEALGRVTSLLGAWNALGTFLMINLLLAIALQAEKHNILFQVNMLIALALCGACLLASGSFAGAGGVVAGIIIAKILDRRGLRVLLLLVVGLGIAAIILQPLISTRLEYQFRSSSTTGLVPETMFYRFQVWERIYLPIIMKNLATGVAPTFANVTWQWAESQYLYLLFRSGLVSLIGHLAWVIIISFWLYRRIRASNGIRLILSINLFAIFIVLSIMGVTNEVFTLSGATDYLWIMLGLVARN